MTEAALRAVFREVPKASMDAEAGVCFVLDEKLRIGYCNPAWDTFAERNGAPHLQASNVLGTAVLDSTPAVLSGYYQWLYGAVLRDRKPRSHDFHCSSPEVKRLIQMQVYGMKSVPALLVLCSVRVETPHDIPSGEAIEDWYRDAHGFIVMCSNCRRTRRTTGAPETWDWVADFVAHPPSMVSHGLCGLCLEYYYPAPDK